MSERTIVIADGSVAVVACAQIDEYGMVLRIEALEAFDVSQATDVELSGLIALHSDGGRHPVLVKRDADLAGVIVSLRNRHDVRVNEVCTTSSPFLEANARRYKTVFDRAMEDYRLSESPKTGNADIDAVLAIAFVEGLGIRGVERPGGIKPIPILATEKGGAA